MSKFQEQIDSAQCQHRRPTTVAIRQAWW